MPRVDGRANLDLRPVRMERGFMPFADGSCLISMGETRIICTASVEERVPMWMKGRGEGWVTAEYAMIPRSGRDRNPREISGPKGRSQEIQRLIGRSLRAVVDMKALGERTITLDCDVLGADGGTRCASICGAYVALAEAVSKLRRTPGPSPLKEAVVAVSVGVVAGVEMLDLCYEEDSRAAFFPNPPQQKLKAGRTCVSPLPVATGLGATEAGHQTVAEQEEAERQRECLRDERPLRGHLQTGKAYTDFNTATA